MGFLFFVFGLAVIFGGLWLVLEAISAETAYKDVGNGQVFGDEEEIFATYADDAPADTSLFEDEWNSNTEWFEDPSYMDVSGNIYHSPCEDGN